MRDVIAAHDESVEGTPLLECVMKDGERTEAGQPRSLDRIRDYAEAQRQQLPERLRRIEPADPPYDVTLSDRLESDLEQTREELEAKMDVQS
jgi:nicotinate phosphoribosyltransferase